MTIELVLLLVVSLFIMMGSLFNRESGPLKIFEDAGPRLAARVEQNLATGKGFKDRNGAVDAWNPPTAAPQDPWN